MTPEPLDDPAAAVHAWVKAFNDADRVGLLSLYAPDAVLWGTFATEPIDSRQGLADYFERALRGQPRPGAEIASLRVQRLGAVSVATGAYDLQLNLDDGRRSLPARFTFVLVPAARGWRIANHHSSVMPA